MAKKAHTLIATLIATLMLSGCAQVNAPDTNNAQHTTDNQLQQPRQSQQTEDNGGGISTNTSRNHAARIGFDKAKQIALDYAGIDASRATFIKEKLDYDNGREGYEIEFSVPYNDQSGQTHYRHQIYEYEIDAYSGQIINYNLELE